MSATVQLVSLGIQAALKLARTGRAIYVEETIDRALVLPLPATFDGIDVGDRAFAFARTLRSAQPERFRLHYRADYNLARSTSDSVTDADVRAARVRITERYLLEIARGTAEDDWGGASPATAGRLALAQYGEDRPFPHPLQRVAGTLAELAVDYFLHVPGSLDQTTATGKAVTAMLEGLDEFRFADESWDQIVVVLFKTGLDALDQHPELLTGNEDRQIIVKKVLGGVSSALGQHLAAFDAANPAGDLDALDRLARAGEVAARALLSNSLRAFAENPDLLGITHAADQAVFRNVGQAVVDILLGDHPDGTPYTFGEAAEALVSSRGLDRLVLAFVEATAQNPAFFRVDDEELRGFIGVVLDDLYANHAGGKTFLDPDLFLEVASAVFENGVRDLPRLLSMTDDERAVTVEVARLVYDLVTEVDESTDEPVFSLSLLRSDLLAFFRSTLAIATTSETWIAEVDSNTSDARRAIAILRTALTLLLDDGPQGLPTLLANERFDALLAAFLDSGLAAQILDAGDVADLEALRGLIVTALGEDGLTGLSRLFEEGRLLDLMNALSRSPITLAALLGDAAPAREAAIARLVGVVGQLRSGTVLSVPAMITALEAPANPGDNP